MQVIPLGFDKLKAAFEKEGLEIQAHVGRAGVEYTTIWEEPGPFEGAYYYPTGTFLALRQGWEYLNEVKKNPEELGRLRRHHEKFSGNRIKPG